MFSLPKLNFPAHRLKSEKFHGKIVDLYRCVQTLLWPSDRPNDSKRTLFRELGTSTVRFTVHGKMLTMSTMSHVTDSTTVYTSSLHSDDKPAQKWNETEAVFATHNKFCSCSCFQSDNALLDEMERVYKTLQRRYRQANLTFGKGLTEKGETKKISHVFVKLMVLERGDLTPAFKNATFGTAKEASRRLEHVFNDLSSSAATIRRCVELSEIFPHAASHEESFRVLVLASAGCGKTTLVMKYCPLMWANGELWSGMFDLVICGELRNEDIRCAEDVGGLLGGWGRLGIANVEDKQGVMDFIADHPHRVCLILDGLDETKLESCSRFVQDILRGEELHGLRVILTSRPCDDAFALCEECPFSQRLEVVGFLPADVEEYVRRVLNDELATELLGVLAEDMNLASVMSTPYFAARVCELYKWSQRIPRCVSDIHELMVLQIAESRSKKSFKSLKELPADFLKPLLDLGEFALRMLLAKRLCFPESEMRVFFSLCGNASPLGMLVSCEPDPIAGRERQYRFSHLVLQEFFSALFVAMSGRLYPGKIARLVEALGALSGHLNTFWQLLASQLDSECMDCLCNSLLLRKHTPLPVSEMDALLFDHTAIPSNVLEALCGLLSLSSMEVLAGKLLHGLVAGDAVTAVENEMQCSRKSNNNDFLRTLLAMWLRCSPKAHVGTLLEYVDAVDSCAASSCCEITGIDLSTLHTNLLPIQRKTIDKPFKARRDLVYRCFMEYTHGAVPPACHVSVSTISDLLTKCEVYIAHSMSQSECFALEHVLKHHSHDATRVKAVMSAFRNWHRSLYNLVVKSGNLEVLEVFGRGEEGFLPSSLPRNEHMELVSLRGVPSTSLPSIAVAMDKWPYLGHLVVHVEDPSATTEEEATAFLSAVARNSHVHEITMWTLGDGTTSCQHFRRLLDQNAYPSSVKLCVVR